MSILIKININLVIIVELNGLFTNIQFVVAALCLNKDIVGVTMK